MWSRCKLSLSVLAQSFLWSGIGIATASFIKEKVVNDALRFNETNTLIWVILALMLVAFYVINVPRINRTLREKFTLRRLVILFLSGVIVCMAALNVQTLQPNLSDFKAWWLWAGITHLALCELVVIAYVTKKRPPSIKGTIKGHLVDNPKDNTVPLTDIQTAVGARLETLVESSADLSIALTGSWGAGKTRVLHEVETKNKNLLWFFFYPWAYTDEDALIKDFYSRLLSEIDQAAPRLSILPQSTIKASVKRLTDGSISSSIFAVLPNILMGWAQGTDNPEEILAQRLENENLKIVVVMDDLERVQDPRLINRALQLVHHLRRQNIKGITFITVFERDAINNALPAHVKHSPRFIEKFFDTEVLLPDPLLADLEKQLIRQLPDALKPEYVRPALLRDLGSHRAILRLVNEYQTSDTYWSKSKLELGQIINLNDYLVLTHIQLKYPFVYTDIHANRAIYTQTGNNIDEESIAFQMMDDNGMQKVREEHFTQLLDAHGVVGKERDTIKTLLADIFTDTAQALGKNPTKTTSYQSMRKERRVSLRAVLDATFGILDSIEDLAKNEAIARRVVETMSGPYTPADIDQAVQKLVASIVDLPRNGWDAALHILTSEIEENDTLHDAIPDLVSALTKHALLLDYQYDDGRKTRIIGQAFYIFVDTLLIRIPDARRKREIISKLNLPKLITFSKTPFGTTLMARLDLSSDAKQIRIHLDEKALNKIRIHTRKHYEAYYLTDKHDAISESKDILSYLEEGWQAVIGNNNHYKALYNEWYRKNRLAHPSFFLDKYTTKTHRGNWAFKEDDYGTVRPVKDIPLDQLKVLVKLAKLLSTSSSLTERNKDQLNMIADYASRHGMQLARTI